GHVDFCPRRWPAVLCRQSDVRLADAPEGLGDGIHRRPS
ncbi:MAG: hypothetical protein AVDCRST_MAG08-3925, partial [uncultured Acetobacteraceae bacterium]